MVSQIFEASPSSRHDRRAENKQKKGRKETVEDAVFPRVSVVAVLSTQAEDSGRGTSRRRSSSESEVQRSPHKQAAS